MKIQSNRSDDLASYLTVGQAAALLGVSPWTLRNWDNDGRLKSRRHPKNGYRMYRREDLNELIAPPGAPGKPGDRLASHFDWSQINETEHFVQFYEGDAFLMDAVAGFVGEALRDGHAGVVIADGSHRNGIEQRLRARGVDLDTAAQEARYVCLDAAQTLEMFMSDGSPDPQRFEQAIGAVLARAGEGGRRVRAFGEMVALLWRDGNRAAAVRLEELWNDLARAFRFSLFCAYPLDGFAGATNGQPMTDVCTCHTRVIPAESYAALSTADQRLREIALLQQKAHSLASEAEQRREAEEALRASERDYHRLMELLPAGVYMCDAPDGRIRYCNRRAVELWGREPLPADRYCGSTRAFRLDGTPLPLTEAPMGRVLAGGPAVRNHELIIERPDGSRIVAMVNVDPITDAAGRVVGAVNVFQDITERKIVESELQRAKAAAEDASRAKDQFLAVLSHELRTPLTPVLLSVASMETEPGLPRQVRDDLAMIRRNISLETQLIDDLLDLSRVVNGKMPLHRQHIDVHSLIRNVVEMVAGNAEPHCITLAIKLQAAHDRVHADSARLHQVLWNLLKNAIKFTPAGGSVTIRTANPEPGRLTIEVSDTGIGIEPDALGRIFDAFDQGARAGDRRFGGLGLGLAISKAVVEMHDGTIRAHSDGKGRGSCFCVDLPVATTHELRASDGCEPAVGAGDALPLRILLVEDHADSLRLLRRLLEKFGHLVTTASSVAEATAAADAYPFDLLVSDIGLPDGTGLDVVRQVRARQPNVFAIALTGYGMEQDVRSAEAAGFAAHMTKPVDLAALRAMIRNVSRVPAAVV